MSEYRLTEAEELAFKEHELEMLEREQSIKEAIVALKLKDKSRDYLEHTVASLYLELDGLTVENEQTSKLIRGVLKSVFGSENELKKGLVGLAVKRSKSLEASKKARKRSEKYDPLRNLAKNLVETGKYKSRRNAAIKIAPKIIEEGKKIGVILSERQAELTIAGWLKDEGLPAKV